MEGLVAGALQNLFRFSEVSLSGCIALGGADNLEDDEAGMGFVDEGRGMIPLVFFCDEVEGVGVMTDPRPS